MVPSNCEKMCLYASYVSKPATFLPATYIQDQWICHYLDKIALG